MGKTHRRILVVGERGVGKSSVANTILGKKHFKPSVTGSEEPYKAYIGCATIGDPPLDVEVIEAPCMTQSGQGEEAVDTHSINAFIQDLEQVQKLWPEGFDVLVFVLKFGNRFTQEQVKANNQLKRIFGEKIISERCIVVFSHGDRFEQSMDDEDTPDKSFDSWCSEQRGDLKHVLDECCGRKILLNNRLSMKHKNNQAQQLELMHLLNSVTHHTKQAWTFDAVSRHVESDTEIISKFSFPSTIGKHPQTSLKRASTNSYRVLVVGQSGSGKSSVCNTILGQKAFKPSSCGQPNTFEARFKEVVKTDLELQLEVMDGPSIAEITRTDEEYRRARQNLERNLKKLQECWPDGFHCLVYVMKFGDRFTEEQVEATSQLKKLFGENFFMERCIIVISCGDRFLEAMEDEDTPEKTFQQWCIEQEGALKMFIEHCGRRCVLFDNRVSRTDGEQTKRFYELLTSSIPRQLNSWPNSPHLSAAAPVKIISTRETAQRMIQRGFRKRTQLNILIVGPGGSGKSSVANFILGRRAFKPSSSAGAPEFQAVTETSLLDDPPLHLVVMDGPSIAEVTRTDEEHMEAAESFVQDLVKVRSVWPEGFDVLVYVTKFGPCFTEEQVEANQHLKLTFGDNLFSEKCIIVMTHGDIFEQAMEEDDTINKSFEQWCTEQTGALGNFLKKTKSRRILFNKRANEKNYEFLRLLRSVPPNRKASWNLEKLQSSKMQINRTVHKKNRGFLQQSEYRRFNLLDIFPNPCNIL